MPRPLPLESGPELTVAEFGRYSRQLVLPEFGVAGQRRLRAARVLVLGAGGLGSPVLLYLAAAGVGTIGIVDFDQVEESNLHRQVIHPTAAVGRSKVASAVDAVTALNPGVMVVPHEVRLTETNAVEIFTGYDVVLDGTDNFPTRYLANDTCVALGIPLIWASVLGFIAQVAVLWPAGGGPQLRDLFPHPPEPGSVPNCAEAGVIGALCGQTGSIMAMEAVKLLTGIGRSLLGRVLVIDMLAGRWDEIPLRPATDGPASTAPRDPAAILDPPTTPDPAPPGSRGTKSVPPRAPEVGSPLRVSPQSPRDVDAFLLDVREPAEFAAGHLPGSLNIPLAQLLAGDGPALPAERRIVVICRSGARAAVAAAALQARGFTATEVLEGGLLAQHP